MGYLYLHNEDNEDKWNPVDAVLWVEPNGKMVPAKSPDIEHQELDYKVSEYEISNEWDGYGAELYKLVNGDYLLTCHDYDTTFSSARAYRAADLETIVRWAMSDGEREAMGYELYEDH